MLQDHASSVTVTLFFRGGSGASYPRDHSRLLPGAWALSLAISSSGRLYHTLPQGLALSSFPVPKWPLVGKGLTAFTGVVSFLPLWLALRPLVALGYGPRDAIAALSIHRGSLFCWAVSHGRAWAWEPISGIPATHLVP